jgi:hypothetical protein
MHKTPHDLAIILMKNENEFQGEIHLYTASMHVNVRIYKIEAVTSSTLLRFPSTVFSVLNVCINMESSISKRISSTSSFSVDGSANSLPLPSYETKREVSNCFLRLEKALRAIYAKIMSMSTDCLRRVDALETAAKSHIPDACPSPYSCQSILRSARASSRKPRQPLSRLSCSTSCSKTVRLSISYSEPS